MTNIMSEYQGKNNAINIMKSILDSNENDTYSPMKSTTTKYT